MMWRGCSDKELCWWCVRSWDEIRMVHRSMGNGSRVANELYIKRVLLVLEDFLFFFLYSFSCIAKQVTTLEQFRLLTCLDSLDTNFERLSSCLHYHIWVSNITYAQPCPLHYAFKFTLKRQDTSNFTWLYTPIYASWYLIKRLAELKPPGTRRQMMGSG